ITEVAGHPEWVVTYAMILAGLGMTFGNIIGAKMAEKMGPLHATILALALMAVGLIFNTYLASDKIAILVMTFLIGLIAFCISTPVQLMMINTAKESKMLSSSLNQSAFNIGNAAGAYFAGLPIAFGYSLTSADLVGAALATSGVLMAVGILFLRKQKVELATSKT